MKTKSEKPSPAEMNAAIRRHVTARVAALDNRLGTGIGATRERARLARMKEGCK